MGNNKSEISQWEFRLLEFFFLHEDTPPEFRIGTTILADCVQACTGMPKVPRVTTLLYFKNDRLNSHDLLYANKPLSRLYFSWLWSGMPSQQCS